jgi:hypothetical protein
MEKANMFLKLISFFTVIAVHGMNIYNVPDELVVRLACLLNNPNPYFGSMPTNGQHTHQTLYVIKTNHKNSSSKNDFTSFKCVDKKRYDLLVKFINENNTWISKHLSSSICPEILYNYFDIYHDTYFFLYDSTINPFNAKKACIRPTQRNKYRLIFKCFCIKNALSVAIVSTFNESKCMSDNNTKFILDKFPEYKTLIPIIKKYIFPTAVPEYISSLEFFSETIPIRCIDHESKRKVIEKTCTLIVNQNMPIEFFKKLIFSKNTP